MSQLIEGIAGQFDRLPPHSVEAEMCLLASMMLDKECIGDVMRLVNRESFFQADHQIIFDMLVKLHEQNRAIDAMIVREELAKRQLLEEVGGVPYLAQILNSAPSAAHAVHYAGIVREKSILRQLIAASNNILRAAYAPQESAEAVVEKAVAAINNIHDHGTAEEILKLEDVLLGVMDSIDAGEARRIATGLTELDECTGGLPLGGYTLIGGRPGMGKSLIVKQIALNIARGGIPVGIISIEEGRQKIGENYLANGSHVENNHIAYRRMDEHEFPALHVAVNELAKLPIYVTDTPLTITSIRAAARRMVRKFGCQVIAVDHLHLIDGQADMQREQELTKISGALKAEFKAMGVASMVAAQLNRGGEGRDIRPPELRDLRGSGSLEQDGDLIIFLHRPDYYRSAEDGPDQPNLCLAIVAKNKAGPCGTRSLWFSGKYQAISDWNGGIGRYLK